MTFCLSPSLAAPLVEEGRRDESDEHFKDKKVFIWPLNFLATPVGWRDDDESLRRKMSTSRTRRCPFILSSAVVAPPVDGHLTRALKAHVGRVVQGEGGEGGEGHVLARGGGGGGGGGG